MYQMVRITIATLAVIFASIPSNAQAQVAATQIKPHGEADRGVHRRSKVTCCRHWKRCSALSSDRPNAKFRAELETSLRFRNFAEYGRSPLIFPWS
jgi:hypothetical protein